jgi:hypothetical protein
MLASVGREYSRCYTTPPRTARTGDSGMTLDELRRICVESTPDDWNVIQGSHLLLSDAHNWDDDGELRVVVASHICRAAYKPDLSIGLAWGLPLDDKVTEPWATRFPDKTAESHRLDILYAGMLVDRYVRVYVDGFRCGLPLPELEHIDEKGTITNYRITRWTYDFFALVDALERGGSSEFADYVERATFKVVDTPRTP